MFRGPAARRITAIRDLDLVVAEGSAVAVMGPSGSGKSTLLQLVGGLDEPTAGTVRTGGVEWVGLRGRRLAEFRRSVGFVFQQFNLLPGLTVLDNVLVSMVGAPAREARKQALVALELVGMAACRNVLPAELSGGEQQRVAIARAVVNRPAVLLADEPTGALDTATGFAVVDLLLGLRDEAGATVLIATHDYAVAARCERIVTLRDGGIVSDLWMGAAADPAATAERVRSFRPADS